MMSPRRSVRFLLVVFALYFSPRAGATPPALAVAIGQAKEAHRALILEFSTAWCGPCQVLAREVLPHPEVKAALAQVMFVQYDAEHEPGLSAAAQLRIGGFPTLVALDAGGRVVERVVGLRRPAELSAWLREVADKARPGLFELLAEARKAPKDAALSLSIARRHLEAGDRASARRWLVTAEKLGGRGPAAEEAGFLRMRIEIADGEQQLRARIARDYLLRFPAGAHAAEAAAICAPAQPAKAEAERVLGPVDAAVDPVAEARDRRTSSFRQLVTRVSRSCRPFANAGGVRRAWVRVQLQNHGIARVTMLEPSLPVMLEACISGELMGLPFAHPIEGEDTFAIQF